MAAFYVALTTVLCAIPTILVRYCHLAVSKLAFCLRSILMMTIAIEPLLALILGILILLVPRFLNYFVAVYLIVRGILGLMPHLLT